MRNRASIISTPEEMTVEQLQARARIHLSTAKMFQERGEVGAAKQFRELASSYTNELTKRGAGME